MYDATLWAIAGFMAGLLVGLLVSLKVRLIIIVPGKRKTPAEEIDFPPA